MKNFIFQSLMRLLIILSCFALYSSCSEDPPSEVQIDPDECDDSKGVDDCISSNPESSTDQISGEWSEANERNIHAITSPGYPGGGYVTVQISENDPDLEPRIIIDNDLSAGGAISGAIGTSTFEYFPGTTYQLEVYPFFNALSYPVGYSLSWTFTPLVDCFEPNNTIEDASKILLNTEYEASNISGYIDYNIAAFDDNTYDWYRIETCEEHLMTIELSNVPDNVRLSSRWMDEDKLVLYSTGPVYEGAETDFNRGRSSRNQMNKILPAGIYYIEIHADFIEERAVADDDPLPEHFTAQPYKIKVSFE